MNLSQLAFRFRPVVLLATVAAMFFGAFSYLSLPTREDPSITVREAVVSTRFAGLPAEQVEEWITKPLETRIRQVAEVEHIRSTSMRGQSLIHVEIQDRYFDLAQIWDDVRQKVESARSKLPEGTEAPVVNDDFGNVAVVTAALTSDQFSQAEQLQIAEHVRARLYDVEGSRKVELHGVQPERIYIDVSESRLANLGLTPVQLASQLSDRNVISPAGVLESGEQRLALQVSGAFPDLEALRASDIRLPDGGSLRLADLGAVNRGYLDPPANTAYHNGKRAIVFAISMADGYSVLDYGEAVRARLDNIGASLPAGYNLDIMTFQADQVANAVYGVSLSVIQTLAIVLAVVVLFLGIRTGLIVGSTVPAVMLVTLALMGLFDMTLQRMSLATLVIALGLLVDNAIVVAEDFKVRLAEGKSRDLALKQTGGELAMPLLSSTLTTILVFLPLMLAEHVSGEYTRSISIVIALSLLTSWLLSMTVVLIWCHRFMQRPADDSDSSAPQQQTGLAALSERLFRAMSSGYEVVLRRCLRHRPLFLIAVVALLFLGIGLMQVVPKKFFPDSDRHQVLVYLDLPSDSASSATDQQVQAVSRSLTESLGDKLTGVAAYAGFGGPRFVLSLTPIDPAPNRGFLVLNVAKRDQMASVMTAARQLLAKEFPQLSSQVTRMFLGPSDSNLLEILVKGPDREVLYDTAAKVEAELRAMPGGRDVRQSWEARIPSLRIEVNQAQADRAGVTSADIASSLKGAIDGYQLSQLRQGDTLVPIVLRYPPEVRSRLERLKSLVVYPLNDPGEGVPLNQVATIGLDDGYYRIDRHNLVRAITIEGRNDALTAEDMMPRITPTLRSLEASLPPGHWVEFDGVVVQSAEGQASMQANLPLCLGLILILLVAQFNSYKRPLLIVVTIPLVILGVSMGLLALRADFGFMVLLGIYSLAGIIINNAIVLIERIDRERRDEGHSLQEAVVRASVRRLRPIVMSAATTILGLLPLIVGKDPLFYAMASAMAFGLGLGTLMSLGVVPVLYTYFFARESGKMPHATETT